MTCHRCLGLGFLVRPRHRPCPACTPEQSAPHQPHSETSREAAEEIRPVAGELRKAVFVYIKQHGGATDEEVQKALEMSPNTQRPRRVELVDRGMVRDSGQKRRTKSGRKAVVWEAA